MKTQLFPRFVLKGFLVLMATLTTTIAPTRVMRPMDFRFHPAVEGGYPSMEAVPNGNAEDSTIRLRFTAYALDNPKGATLVETCLMVREAMATETVSFVLPTRGQPDILGVRVEKLVNPEKPDFVGNWRAKFDMTKSVMDYKGNAKTKRPKDFEQFWADKKAKLAAVPMNAVITPVPEKKSATGNCYKIVMQSYGGMTIAAWYFVPNDVDPLSPTPNGKKYPAIQIAPGYGAEETPIDRTADGYITLSMNPRGHGPSKEFWPLPAGHHLYKVENPDEYYYTGAYMDIVRGLDFLSSRPEVDANRLGQEGGSQGGAFALAAAGLDSRVKAACANVPYICNLWDYSKFYSFGQPILDKMLDPKIGKMAQKSLMYCDPVNLAESIKCPVQITVGLTDRVCPPLGGIVAHNRIPAGVTRKLVMDPMADHEISPIMRQENADWFKTYLKP